MKESRPIELAQNYGSMQRTTRPSNGLTGDQSIPVRRLQQTYTSLPFLNSIINAAVEVTVSQVSALFNQDVITPPPADARLKHILENAKYASDETKSHPIIPQLIDALRTPRLTDENRRIFVVLAESASGERTTMSDAVKRDIIFILNSSLSSFEGVQQNKIGDCIKSFENTFIEENKVESSRGFQMR